MLLNYLPAESAHAVLEPNLAATWTSSKVTGCVEKRDGNLSDVPDFRDLYLSIPALPKRH